MVFCEFKNDHILRYYIYELFKKDFWLSVTDLLVENLPCILGPSNIHRSLAHCFCASIAKQKTEIREPYCFLLFLDYPNAHPSMVTSGRFLEDLQAKEYYANKQTKNSAALKII